MLEAQAIRSFRRSDNREWVKRGQRITGTDSYIMELKRVGNVRLMAAVHNAPENKARPKKPVGAKLSVSPAGQASRQTKSTKSKPGAKKKAKAKKA